MADERTTVEFTTQPCMLCGKRAKLVLDEAGYMAFKSGVHVQDAFPELSPYERELLISGTHEVCFKQMFPDE